MAIDWADLVTRTAQYNSLTTQTDPVSGAVDIIFAGLRARLSEVIAGAPAAGAASVAIFADTLVVDVASVKLAGLVLMAREIDVSSLNGQPLVLDSSGDSVAQFLVGGAIGGTFRIASSKAGAASVAPALGASPLDAVLYEAPAGGDYSAVPDGGLQSVQDLVSRSWALNSLRAGFSAAATLMDQGTDEGKAAAQAMFAWSIACTGSLSTSSLPLPSDYGELYNQAATLLVTLNVAPGAIYVPVLASEYYSGQMDRLVTVLGTYESWMNTLDTQSDISKAVASVSAALKDVTGDEAAPLQVQLDNIKLNIHSLYNDIRDLQGDLLLQGNTADAYFQALAIKIELDNIRKELEAEIGLIVSLVKLGGDAAKAMGGDADGLFSAVGDGMDSVNGLIKVVEANQAGGAGDDLTTQAVNLAQSQGTLMQTLVGSNMLWEQALANRSGGVLPTNLAAITVDPVTSWDNYLAAFEARMTSLRGQVGDSADVQDAINTYEASVKVLVGYGKAVGGKFAAYVAQLVNATVVLAQIKASQDAEARWAALQAEAKSDEEKLAALKALVQARADSIKRSIFVAWNYYAASYFYLNFASPPHIVHLDMNAAGFGAALAGVADWVAQAVSDAPDGQHVRLPNKNATIELDFPLLKSDGSVGVGDAAILTGSAAEGWTLNWTVPLGTDQLKGVLPNNGNCAVWISSAQFFLTGVTGNSKQNVIATVATSGAYQNGFGPGQGHMFVTKGLSGTFSYHLAGEEVFSPWSVDSAVYMTPTLYTQWTMNLDGDAGDPSTATTLRMNLTIAFLTPPPS
ncbi:MAG TPA: hypothetical protein VF552_13660 [Allosphingosinicella sp.]|jgi:hypothetical protein